MALLYWNNQHNVSHVKIYIIYKTNANDLTMKNLLMECLLYGLCVSSQYFIYKSVVLRKKKQFEFIYKYM